VVNKDEYIMEFGNERQRKREMYRPTGLTIQNTSNNDSLSR